MIERHPLWLRTAAASWIIAGIWTAGEVTGHLPELPHAVSRYALAALVAATLVGFIGRVASEAVKRRTEAVEPVAESFQHGYRLGREHCANTCVPRPDAKVLQFPAQPPPLPTQREPVRPAVGQSRWVDPDDSTVTTVVLPKIRDVLHIRRPAPRRSGR